MNDDNIPTLNPYAATPVSDVSPVSPLTRSYGGIGRLAYFAFSFIAGIVYNIVLAGIAGVGNESVAVLVLFIVFVYLGVLLWIVALRMINMGYSPWWCLGMLVPLLNILVGLRCIASPEGYADHRTLDTAGKVIVGIILGAFALGLIALFLSIGFAG